MEPITLTYSKALIKKAVRSYLWRQLGLSFLLMLIVLTGFTVFLLARGDRSWIVGVLGAVVFLSVAVISSAYIIILRRFFFRLQSMGKWEATLELMDNSFRVSSGAGNAEVKWTLIRKVWRFHEVWILFFSADEIMTLPVKNLSKENQKFILSRLPHAKVT